MAQWERLACSPSTFNWWAAWLGHRPGRVVVVPREGPFRPGAPFVNPDFWLPDWQAERALRPVIDDSRALRLRHLGTRATAAARRLVRGLS